MEKIMLKPQNKIFKNLYNDYGWEIDYAIKRDDWKETKNIISKNNIYILKWEMIYFAFNKNNSIFGLSEVTIGANKKIVSHIDYWDSYNNFYTKIPIIGQIFQFVFNFVKKRI